MHAYKIVQRGQPLDRANKALILIHGRGGSALDILGIAKELDIDDFYITALQATNGSWYPYSFMADEATNEPWLASAVSRVTQLITETSQKIPLEHIYLLGFSQGACLALEVATRHAQQYGGIIAFSGGLIGSRIDMKKYSGNFHGAKVFIGNSDIDPHVPLERSQQSKKVMEKLGADVTLKVYPGMSHSINRDELDSAKIILHS